MSGKKEFQIQILICISGNLYEGLHSYWRSLQNSSENIQFSNEYEVS